MAKKILISGGGTGGHVFPAIAIANALKVIDPSIDILFVGAEGRIEMHKVPASGYAIKALPVRGFERKISLGNLKVLAGLVKSLFLSRKIVREFKPDVAVGVGGYASGPIVYIASRLKVPTLLQEQNSYAGITNKILAKKANKICVAYDNMDRFFPSEKIVKTGNPVRKSVYERNISKNEACTFFKTDDQKKTILILGGSGGARTINEAVINKLDFILESGIQFIWQTGKFYFEKSMEALQGKSCGMIRVFDFINEMDLAFAAADVVVSRAGAGTISELCLLGKPSILVPSPNVAEDHQTKNATALVEKSAALLIKDIEARDNLIPTVLELARNQKKLEDLSRNIKLLAIPGSDEMIAREILKLCE